MRTLVLVLVLVGPLAAAEPPVAPVTATLGSADRKLVGRPVAVRVHAGEPRVSVLTDAGDLQTWDVRTGKLVGGQAMDKQLRDPVRSGAFTPDGRWVFARIRNNAVQYDTRTQRLTRLAGNGVEPTFVGFAISADGKTLVYETVGSGPVPDREELHFGVASELVIGTLAADGFQETRRVAVGPGAALAVSSDGRLIARLEKTKTTNGKSGNGTVRLVDTAGRTVRSFGEFTTAATVGPFSPDGSRLLTSAFNDKTQLWDVATGRAVREWPAPLGGGDSRFTPDGTGVFVGGSVGGVPHYRLVRTDTGDTVRDFPVGGRWSRRSDLTADGTTLVTVDDATVRIWDVATAKERVPTAGHAGRVTAVAFLPDGSGVVSGGSDGTARVWTLPAGAEAFRLPPPPVEDDSISPVSAVAVSADGSRVAVGQRIGGLAAVRVWERRHNRVTESPAGHALFSRTAFMSSGAVNANSGGAEGSPQLIQHLAFEAGSNVCRVLAGNRILRLSPELKPLGPEQVMPGQFGKGETALIRDEAAVALAAGVGVAYYEGHEFDEMRVWDFGKNELRAALRLADNVRPRVSAVAPNGRFAVVYDARGAAPTTALLVYDLATLNELGRFACDTPPPVVISADSRLCAVQTGRQPTRFTIFDVARFAPVAVVSDPSRTARLAFSPDGRRAATGGTDSLVRVHDLRAAFDPTPPAFDAVACWADLVSADGATAMRAVSRLADHPPDAVKLFREKLKPAAKPAAADVAAWVKALDAPAFAARQAAAKKLAAAADPLDAELRQEAATNASPEAVRAINAVRDAAAKSRRRLEGEHLRAYRVVQTLEAIGPPAAALLKEYAAGEKAAFLTQEADAAAGRQK